MANPTTLLLRAANAVLAPLGRNEADLEGLVAGFVLLELLLDQVPYPYRDFNSFRVSPGG
jgi:hypothetical protein